MLSECFACLSCFSFSSSPISHSRSPQLHGYWLDHYGIDGAYVPQAYLPEGRRYYEAGDQGEEKRIAERLEPSASSRTVER